MINCPRKILVIQKKERDDPNILRGLQWKEADKNKNGKFKKITLI